MDELKVGYVPRVHGKRLIPSPRRNQDFYGAPVGILTLERGASQGYRPYIPGSVGNASTWSVPPRYKTIVGHGYEGLIDGSDEGAKSAVVGAAVQLEEEGARLITSNCGFMIRHQEDVQAAVNVPVLLSSVLLAPILLQTLSRDRSIGIITANGGLLTQDLLEVAGVRPPFERVVIGGLEAYPAFATAFLRGGGDLDVAAVEAEVVDLGVTLIDNRPDIGVFLLECSELPPYAAAIQRATGLPVFDFTSLVELFIGGVGRKEFIGII